MITKEAPSSPVSRLIQVENVMSVPCYHSIEEVYEDVPAAKARFDELNALFREKYHCDPDFYVRAPGRVNLIGEHIDYHGYSVFPMAIANDMIIAVGSEENTEGATEFSVYNVNPSFEAKALPVDPKAEIGKEHQWSLYFQCGYKGAFDSLNKDNCVPRLLKICISGTVPPAAGVSSSSSFVVASCMATALANHMAFDKNSLAETARVAEFYIGTMGGGMDQAMSVHGIRGYASHIQFNPLRAHPVQLPEGGVFVISNTFYQAPKAVTAATGYNLRVVEGRLAAKLVAKEYGLPNYLEYTSLQDLQKDLGNKPLKEMQEIMKERLHKEPFTTEEIEAILGVPLKQDVLFTDRPAAAKVLEVNNQFYCLQRALHVYSEAARVWEFREVCEDKKEERKLEKLGELMTLSHRSCDEDYNCSCEQLNELVSLGLKHGSLGSRLTGAGWGGCAIHLVHAGDLDSFMKALTEEYYVKHGFSEEQIQQGLFASKPSAGASYFTDLVFSSVASNKHSTNHLIPSGIFFPFFVYFILRKRSSSVNSFFSLFTFSLFTFSFFTISFFIISFLTTSSLTTSSLPLSKSTSNLLRSTSVSSSQSSRSNTHTKKPCPNPSPISQRTMQSRSDSQSPFTIYIALHPSPHIPTMTPFWECVL